MKRARRRPKFQRSIAWYASHGPGSFVRLLDGPSRKCPCAECVKRFHRGRYKREVRRAMLLRPAFRSFVSFIEAAGLGQPKGGSE